MSESDFKLFNAANFAAIKHKMQKRKGDGSSYIVHPLGVAEILLKEANIKELNVLIAAILHDTIEDTETTVDELKQNFGDEVTKIVLECSDDKSLSKEKRKELQVEHMAHASREAKLVKFADKLYNLRDMSKIPPKGWNQDRVVGYAIWALKTIDRARGTNAVLEKLLDEIISKLIAPVCTLSDKQTIDKLYIEYMTSMSKTND